MRCKVGRTRATSIYSVGRFSVITVIAEIGEVREVKSSSLEHYLEGYGNANLCLSLLSFYGLLLSPFLLFMAFSCILSTCSYTVATVKYGQRYCTHAAFNGTTRSASVPSSQSHFVCGLCVR
jgi:hypothetical protein